MAEGALSHLVATKNKEILRKFILTSLLSGPPHLAESVYALYGKVALVDEFSEDGCDIDRNSRIATVTDNNPDFPPAGNVGTECVNYSNDLGKVGTDHLWDVAIPHTINVRFERCKSTV